MTTLRGLHLTADLAGCADLALLCDAGALRALLHAAVAEAGLAAVGEALHAFPPPGGVTAVVLLAESHVALHTWPEHGTVTLDVHVCNRGADNGGRARALMARIERAFAPVRVERHAIERGG